MQWRHRCTACCGKSILRDITVTFLYIFPKIPLDLEPDSIVRKSIKWRFQQYLVRTEILLTFHTRVEYISRRTIRHSAHSNECAQTHRQTDRQKWKQYICQFHSVHLADIIMSYCVTFASQTHMATHYQSNMLTAFLLFLNFSHPISSSSPCSFTLSFNFVNKYV